MPYVKYILQQESVFAAIVPPPLSNFIDYDVTYFNDAIYVKTDPDLKYSNRQDVRYATQLTIGFPGSEPLENCNHYESFEVEVCDAYKVKVINTMVDGFVDLIRMAQTSELLAGPLATRLPAIVMGRYVTGFTPYVLCATMTNYCLLLQLLW